MLQKMKNKPACLVIGLLGMIALLQTISITPEAEKSYVAVTNSFFGILVCVFSAVLYKQVCQKTEIKKCCKTLIGILYSTALGAALTAGKYLETVENLNVGDLGIWINILILSVYFTPFVLFGWQWLEEKWETGQTEQNNKIGQWENKERLQKEKQFENLRQSEEIQQIRKLIENHNLVEKNIVKEFWKYWLIIFVCWIPVFLAFYPGAFVYDATDEYVQVATRQFTTHHPLAHVLLLGGFVCAGNKFFSSFNIGIALYTICQMLLLSGVFSYTVCYLRTKVKNKYVTWGAVLFYGLFPVIPMYAVCCAKDGIFTAAFLLVVIKMLQCLENPLVFTNNKGNIAVSVLAAAVMMLFRNNGMYAYMVWILVIAAGCLFLKKDKKSIVKIVMIMIASFVVFLGCSKMLTMVTDADDSESQEIMTVPIQQMVRTYVYSPETYTEEEKEILFEILPGEDMHLYNARLSDLIKSKFNNEAFNQDKGKYLGLWAKIGFKKPMIYLNAWLMTSYGYWYPDAVINVYGGNTVHTFTYQDSSYFGFETEYPGTRESKFPWLEEQYRKMSLELYQQKIPGISMLFSPGFLFWVFMFCFCYCLQQGSWEKVIAFAGILLLWLTAVLGPTYLVRYVLILWFALPVIVAETNI